MKIHPIKSTLQKLKPFIGKKADSFWIRYQTSDRLERQEWEQTINLIAQKFGVDPVDNEVVLPPPSANVLKGDLHIGNINYLDHPTSDFSLNLPELTRHMGIFGSTGSGKTTLAKNIIRKLIKKKVPFIVFDWERNYRDLLIESKDIKIFTVGDKPSPFYFNYLNRPPGITYQEYVKNVIDVFNRAYIGGVGSDSVLLKVFDQAYIENRIPTTKDVQEILRSEMKSKLRGREMLWKQSSMRMFDFLCYGGTGELLDYPETYPTEKLFDDFVIFELGSLASPNDKRFFIEIFTLWYWLYKEHEGIENETLKHVLIFEEFHNIVLNSSKEDFIQKIFRQIRKYGTGLIVIDQTPALIPNPIFENLYTKISFSLSHAKNVQAISNAMFMDYEERQFLGMLKTGRAICRLMGRYDRPFLIDVPFKESGSNVSDKDIKRHMQVFSEYSRPNKPGTEKWGNIRSIQKVETLSPLGRIMLENISLKPVIGLVKRFKELGLKVSHGYKVIAELASLGMIEPRTIDGNRLYDLTIKGKKILGKKAFLKGRGGLEHRYYIEKIREYYLGKEGFTFIEKDDIDLVVENIHRKMAIQVETGKSDIQANLHKLGTYQADQKYMICTNPETTVRVRDLFKDLIVPDKKNIQIVFVRDFLENPPHL